MVFDQVISSLVFSSATTLFLAHLDRGQALSVRYSPRGSAHHATAKARDRERDRETQGDRHQERDRE